MALPSIHNFDVNSIKSNMASLNWRESVAYQLQLRKSIEQTPFEEICSFANNMFDKVDIYKSENIQLNLQREQLQQQLLGIQQTILAGGSGAAKTILSKLSNVNLNDDNPEANASMASKNLNIQHASLLAEKSQLEKKIFDLQEKLADVLKSKSDNVQKIVDLKTEVDEKDRTNRHLANLVEQLEKQIKDLKLTLTELETKHKTLYDEHIVLGLSYRSLEKRHHTLMLDCDAIREKLKKAQDGEIERMNAENERFNMMQRERAKKEIEANLAEMNKNLMSKQGGSDNNALIDNFETLGDDDDLRFNNVLSKIPSIAEFSFDAHEGGSTAVNWYSCAGVKDDYLATGGQDRKVKVWKIADSNSIPVATFLGSNNGITSIDVEIDAILASSSDMATRVWNLNNHKLNLTLTGHSARVNSAKFLNCTSKVASGSSDRTVKLWDINKGACTRTLFVFSTCYDLVHDNYHVISAHFDKKIRGWDLNKPNDNDPAWMVVLDSKVLSVDISADGTKVVCCLRDNIIKCVDLRTFEVLQTYTEEKFKTGEENWRVKFSNDGQLITCGSSDGSLYIWDVNTAKVEKILKGHNNKVLAACWSPDGKRMVSIENGKKVTVWV